MKEPEQRVTVSGDTLFGRIAALFELDGIDATQFALLIVLTIRAGQDAGSWYSQRTLAPMAKLSRRQVQVSTSELEAAGLLWVHAKGGKYPEGMPKRPAEARSSKSNYLVIRWRAIFDRVNKAHATGAQCAPQPVAVGGSDGVCSGVESAQRAPQTPVKGAQCAPQDEPIGAQRAPVGRTACAGRAHSVRPEGAQRAPNTTNEKKNEKNNENNNAREADASDAPSWADTSDLVLGVLISADVWESTARKLVEEIRPSLEYAEQIIASVLEETGRTNPGAEIARRIRAGDDPSAIGVERWERERRIRENKARPTRSELDQRSRLDAEASQEEIRAWTRNKSSDALDAIWRAYRETLSDDEAGTLEALQERSPRSPILAARLMEFERSSVTAA